VPLYSYECPRGHRFDKIVSIAQMDEYQECPGKLASRGYRKRTPKVVPCRAPAKRIPVPSRPAYVIIR